MSANCNGGIVNIPQAFNGQDGISSYVYIAYAEDVSLGSPDSVNGFSYPDPLPTSEWLAVITSNVPINSPSSPDFDGKWVKFKGDSGVGAAGIDVEQANTVISGGPFTTLNFSASGLTGVTVSDAGNSQADIEIVTAGLNKIYLQDFQTLINDKNLTPGASYWIVDVGDGERHPSNPLLNECSANYYLPSNNAPVFAAYPHTAGIVVRALSSSTCDVNAIYLARVPFGNDSNTRAAYTFSKSTSYNQGDTVESHNMLFTKISNGTSTFDKEPAELPDDWEFIPRDTEYDPDNFISGYGSQIHGCLYDPLQNFIRKRWDRYGNVLTNIQYDSSVSSPSTNNFIKKCFRWGYIFYKNNTICFCDDSELSNSFMAPVYKVDVTTFDSYGSLFNCTTFTEMTDNQIDVELSFNSAAITKFINSRIYNNNITSFLGNKLSGAIISNNNITVFRNNNIQKSVVNNCEINTFTYNTLTNNTIIGDLGTTYQLNVANNATSTNKIVADISEFRNRDIIYNVGSKSYNALPSPNIGDASFTSPSTFDFGNSTFRPRVRPGDTVLFYQVQGVGQDLITALTSKLFVVDEFDPTDPDTKFTVKEIINANNQVINDVGDSIAITVFTKSCPTKFQNFSDNTIESSIVRGMNKGIFTQTFFLKNTLVKCYFENYYQRPNATGVLEQFTSFYDGRNSVGYTDGTLYTLFSEQEFGYDPNNTGGGGFSENRCTDVIMYNTRLHGRFSNNDLKGVAFINNAPTFTTGTFTGNAPAGFGDQDENDYVFFTYNKMSGNTSFNVQTDSFAGVILSIPQVGGFYSIINSPSIYISRVRISGENNSVFSYNTITDSCLFQFSRINGSFAGNKISINGIQDYSKGAATVPYGIVGLSVPRQTSLLNNVFEGRTFLKDIEINNSITKETGYVGKNAVENLILRDTLLGNIYGTSTKIPFTPNIFYSPLNPIRNVELLEEGTTSTQILGNAPPVSYTVANWEIRVTTQQPHFLNASLIGRPFPIYLQGLQFLFVSELVIQTNPSVITKSYFAYSGYNPDVVPFQGPYSLNIVVGTIVLDSIDDEYQFVGTLQAGTNLGFLLANGNTADAQIASPFTNPDSRVGTAPYLTSPARNALEYYPNSFTGANGSCFNDDVAFADTFFNPYIAFNNYNLDITTNSFPSIFGTTVNYPNSNAKVTIDLRAASNPSPTPYPLTGSEGSRSYYHTVDYPNDTGIIYNTTTNVLTLPAHIEQLNSTIILGGDEITYNIEKIAIYNNTFPTAHIPDSTRLTFMTVPGVEIVFEVTAVTDNDNDIIVDTNNNSNFTINAYYTTVTGNNTFVHTKSDKLVLERQNNVWIVQQYIKCF